MVIYRWQDAAQCKGQEDIFFNDGRSVFYDQALANCRVCQVSSYCRASALMETEGYWAGQAPRDRQRVRARLNIILERDEHLRGKLNRACDEAYQNGEDPEPHIAQVLGAAQARYVMEPGNLELKIA